MDVRVEPLREADIPACLDIYNHYVLHTSVSLGSWVSAKGIKMEFRDDGTCTIDGKDGYFNVSMYAMSVGTRANDLNQNWQIYSCTDKSLSVINNSNKTQYKLTRVTEE